MGQNLQVLKDAPRVQVGDKVVIPLGKDVVQFMQNGHKGWVNNMENCLGKKGKVVRIDRDGDVEIKFGIRSYMFNPNVVAKVLSKGDKVRISDKIEKAKMLQDNHGGWNPNMETILGKVGHVKRVLKTYDVIVSIDSDTWCLNPLLLTVVEKSSRSSSSDEDDSDDDIISGMLSGHFKLGLEHLKSLVETVSTVSIPGNKILHACVYQGNKDMAETLLEKGANVNETDNDGDTALHLAVMKDNPSMVRFLLKKGAKADILNKKNHAPIHIAFWAGFNECVKELLDTSINLKDKDGDTPLGLAIMKEKSSIIDLLLNHSQIDLKLTNEVGFAAIHLAAKAGDVDKQ